MMGHYMADHDSEWGSAQYSDLPHYTEIAATKPHTFGAALARAEKLLALPAPEPSLPDMILDPIPTHELELPALPAPVS
jgi:hypothetical protein